MLPVMSSAPSGRLRALSAYSLRGLSPDWTNKDKALQALYLEKNILKNLMWDLFNLNRLTFWSNEAVMYLTC